MNIGPICLMLGLDYFFSANHCLMGTKKSLLPVPLTTKSPSSSASLSFFLRDILNNPVP